MATHPEHLLLRAADGSPLTDADRRTLELHLESCEACRAELDSQRLVARMLQARVAAAPGPGFSVKVGQRIDREMRGSGFLDMANWRAWTVGLAPLAAGLVLMAYLGVGSTTADSASSAVETTATFDDWASGSAGGTPAAVFLQPGASGDQLLETILTGAVPSSGGSSDVR